MNKESQTTFHEAQPTQEQETKTKTAGTACASPLKTKHTTKCNCQMTCINNTLFKWELLSIWFQCRKQQLKTIIVNKLLAILVLHTTSWRWKKIIAVLKQFTPAHSHMILLSANISHKLHDKTKQKPTTDCFCARLQQTMHQCKVRIRYGNQVSQLMCNERRNLLHKGFSWCSLLSSKLIAGLSLSVILDCSEVRQSSSLVYLPIDFLLQEQSWAAQQELLKSALDRKIRGTNVGRQISSFMPQSSICTTAEVASKKWIYIT